MFVVPVIALVLILLWAAISPESMWSTTSAWQYRDPRPMSPPTPPMPCSAWARSWDWSSLPFSSW